MREIMLQRVLTFMLIIVSTYALAQNGTISGVVTDATTGETVIGANVVIQGTTVGAATDIDGKFTIANVKPGTYNLQVTFVTYKAHVIPDVVVESGKKTDIQVQMQEDVSELQEVVITGTREINNDLALIDAIKESKLVVSGISAEQITRLPDRDAAQIAQRVPGITIADNRFILIRGVPERYNQVLINGIIGPSTEIDKRSFSFDLIPAGAIDQMLIYKSGAAELPGDFAGGVIKVITKKPTNETFLNVGVGFGYRANTTFQDHAYSDGSNTDKFGFDDGFRNLPSEFPTTAQLKAANRNSSIRERAGKSLNNNFGYQTKQAPLDMGFNISGSKPFTIGNINFNNLTTLSYSNSYQYAQSTFKRYNEFDVNSAEEKFSYTDDFYANDVKVNLLHNWLIDFNEDFQLEFKNLFVQYGEHETTLRSGNDRYQLINYDRKNYAYHYLSRSIYTGQLEGTHHLGDDRTAVLNWGLGLNRISRNEPDYRRFRTIRDKAFAGTEEPFLMQLPSAGNLFETGRFWSELQDQGYSHVLNFEKSFGSNDEKRRPVLRAGYLAEYKSRTFDARYMNYLYPDGAGFDQQVGEELRRLPINDIFSPTNVKRENGFVVEEATTPQDHYEGSNMLGAAYVGGTYPAGKFDITAGFRGEYNRQELTSESNLGTTIEVDNPIFAALPSLNLAYNIGDRSLLRAAYSRTVNRPEFRELAPFLYYQFEYEVAIYGNPDLETAFVNNMDLRYELYPNPGELVSLGAFYKDFTNPIETYLQITAENPQLYFGNAPGATSYGVEVEFRKSLSSLGVSKLLRNTSVNINASWIESQVDIGNTATNQVDRPMQGQSPYIINAGIYYNDDQSGFSANVAFNVFGPRIFSVGDRIFPSWWEMPRNSLDFQVAKIWNRRFETKLNIQNALNTAYRLYQDNNLDNKIEDQEALIQRYTLGTQFAVGLSYKFLNNN
jgi:outer membrane receptor for ferrienterochelin and colicin